MVLAARAAAGTVAGGQWGPSLINLAARPPSQAAPTDAGP